MSGDANAALRRFERDAVAACIGTALLALVVATLARGLGPGLNACAAVVGGGLLMGLSYRGVKAAAEVVTHAAEAAYRPEAEDPRSRQDSSSALLPAEDLQRQQDLEPAVPEDRGTPPEFRPGLARRVLVAVKFFTRYALLALAAYVMLTRLRLHPVGVVAGALAPFLAAAVQVGRLSRARARGPHP